MQFIHRLQIVFIMILTYGRLGSRPVNVYFYIVVLISGPVFGQSKPEGINEGDTRWIHMLFGELQLEPTTPSRAITDEPPNTEINGVEATLNKNGGNW